MLQSPANKISIAMVATDVYTFNVLSRGQLEFLREHGVELTLISGGPAADFQPLRTRGFNRVVRLDLPRRPRPRQDLTAFCRLVTLFAKRRFHTVVSSTPKAMLLGTLAAALTFQKRRIIIVRGRAYENASGMRRKAFLLLDWLTFACANRIIFISPSLRDAFASDGLDGGKKAVVLGSGSSNGVDTQRFAPVAPERRDSIRQAHGIATQDFHIVIVGRIAQDKGIAAALDIIDRLSDLPGLTWTFLGRAEDQDLAKRIDALAAAGVRRVDHTDSPEDWMCSADLHLMLSKREGFGNVAIEAAACNVPTFAFDVVGLRDSVADTISGRLFPFGDLAGLERSIREEIRNRCPVSDRWAGAREWAMANFDRRDVWQRYLEFFRNPYRRNTLAKPKREDVRCCR